MFPLGTVLFPYLPLRLQVFEPRYLTMLAHLLQARSTDFGVVLIERGQEVGGGEQRFGIGTVATIRKVGAASGVVGLEAVGGRRIRVREWLPDDPYPRAQVDELPPLEWRNDLAEALAEAERTVRRTLALASEFSKTGWPATLALDADPVAAAWQLAGAAPLSPLDQVRLLGASSLSELLDALVAECRIVAATLQAGLPGEPTEE